jgi:DNA polymerase-3 subunit epsilon
MPEEAFRVHGLSEDFLSDKPVFADVAAEFIAFIGDAKMVAHNAFFDLKFINAELAALNQPPYTNERIIDTIALARQRIPGAQYSLDALCRRFDIDLSRREKHGALLDAELLAEVYLELIGGRQPGLGLASDAQRRRRAMIESEVRPPRLHAASAEELKAHEAFLASIEDPVWLR